MQTSPRGAIAHNVLLPRNFQIQIQIQLQAGRLRTRICVVRSKKIDLYMLYKSVTVIIYYHLINDYGLEQQS